jgi:hypothetical protein
MYVISFEDDPIPCEIAIAVLAAALQEGIKIAAYRTHVAPQASAIAFRSDEPDFARGAATYRDA